MCHERNVRPKVDVIWGNNGGGDCRDMMNLHKWGYLWHHCGWATAPKCGERNYVSGRIATPMCDKRGSVGGRATTPMYAKWDSVSGRYTTSMCHSWDNLSG